MIVKLLTAAVMTSALLYSSSAYPTSFRASASIASNWSGLSEQWGVSRDHIVFTASNKSNTSAYCNGSVFALSVSGELFDAVVSDIFVPNHTLSIRLHTSGETIERVWSTIDCNT